jgi:hypothetical protein
LIGEHSTIDSTGKKESADPHAIRDTLQKSGGFLGIGQSTRC